ncbi:MAG: peptidoglycan DD-metalloendopeptidase family protein [Bacteroidales bacterium]|nr:peptidoglycan DD-metalloendopeptidase family protein [Bacteroidales bacterium]
MRFFSIILFSLITVFSFSQNIDSLRDEKQRLQDEIAASNQKLEEFGKMKNSHITQIAIIDEKIARQRRLVNIYKNDLLSYNSQLKILTAQLDSLELSLSKSKEEYANLIRNYQYNYINNNSILYLLSASSFNESYRRLLFMKQYKDYHRHHFSIIEQEHNKYVALKENIDSKRVQLNKTLSSIENEQESLQNELLRRNALVSDISQNQTAIQKQIAQYIEQSKELENKIVQLIEEERKKALASNSRADFSGDIANNKGKLSWPVSDFVIVSQFGQHEHPLYPSIIVNNNGVDINLLSSTSVKAIAPGVVSRVIMIPGSNASIIVRHGSVLSVYSNISEVSVKKDEKVSSSTVLGKVFTGAGLNSRILHFEIWVDDTKQNPEDWLLPR